jgi:hypothetical protein
MSVVRVIIDVSRKEMENKMRKQICVYEMLVLELDTMFCPECREYDGIMPLNRETLDYLKEDHAEWEEEGFDLD